MIKLQFDERKIIDEIYSRLILDDLTDSYYLAVVAFELSGEKSLNFHHQQLLGMISRMNNDVPKLQLEKTTSDIKPKLNGTRKPKQELIPEGIEKRRRSSNFHFQEIQDLLSLIDSEKSIIECKRTDQLTNRYKDKTWKKISHIFNRKNTTKRSDKQLRSKWETLKKIARKEYSSGSLSAVSHNVVRIMLSCNGIEMKFDSVFPIKMKEEPSFHNDDENIMNSGSCNEETNNQEVLTELEDQSNRQENEVSSNQERTNMPNIIPTFDEPETEILNQRINCQKQDSYCPQQSEVSFTSTATQCNLQSFEHNRRKGYWYTGGKNGVSRNFENIFYCSENRRRREKHLLEMRILKVELSIKRKQLENLIQ